MNQREKKVQESASFYNEQFLNIDFKQNEYVYRSIKPYFKGKLALELGPASGFMTKQLLNDFESIHLIEASQKLLDQIPAYSNVIKHCAMFEDFETDKRFDTIIMSHVLEHIENPVQVLKKISKWLSDDGVFIVSVPNALSIHRKVAVKMGLLPTEYTLNERDHALGHYRVYDLNRLAADMMEAGYHITAKGGSFLKPVTNGQIDQNWTAAMIDGFFEVGKEFPEYCADIFVIAGK